jgi:hypothetical protein
MGRMWMLGACVAVLVSHAEAASTDRYFRDRSETSPDGRYRLDARSLDNAGGRPRAFAKNFVYTLTDVVADAVVWKRNQSADEPSPTGVWVHNSGAVAVRTSWDTLIVLDGVTGEKRGEAPILRSFPEDEQKEHVSHTTAGPMWSGGSTWRFFEHGGLYFGVRAWWGTLLIVDAATGQLVRSPGRALKESFEAADRQEVLDTLERGAARLREAAAGAGRPRPEGLDLYALGPTALQASKYQLAEAVPALRELEKYDYSGSSGGWWDMDGLYGVGEINPFNCSVATLRQGVHLALRRLGEKPSELPCAWFQVIPEPNTGALAVPSGALPWARADGVARVVPGNSPRSVLDAVGAPDFVNFEAEAWEYDMDTQPPYTLRIHWKDKKAVDRAERIVPPLWQQGDIRDRQVND